MRAQDMSKCLTQVDIALYFNDEPRELLREVFRFHLQDSSAESVAITTMQLNKIPKKGLHFLPFCIHPGLLSGGPYSIPVL